MAYIDPIEITFLGPTGAGKTSVLAALSEVIKQQAETAQVQLNFGAETWPRLHRAIIELQERCFRPNMHFERGIAEVTYDIGVVPSVLSGWIEGMEVPVRITDYPGEWLDPEGLEEEKIRRVKTNIAKASIIFVAIDTVGLMLSKDPNYYFINERSNMVQQVTNVLREVFLAEINAEPKLVLFVPLRCEKWMDTATNQKMIVDHVRGMYAEVLDMFKSDKFKNHIAVVIAPVQTLGIIEFLQVGPRREKPVLDTDAQGSEIIPSGLATPMNHEVYFTRVGNDKVPKPQYADHLLRYALAFSMVLASKRTKEEIEQELNEAKQEIMGALVEQDDPALWKWFVNTFIDPVASKIAQAATRVAEAIVNWPTNEALRHFASGRLETLPFHIEQGKPLLTRE